MKDIEFTELCQWYQKGVEYQRSSGYYKNIELVWTIGLPLSIFKKSVECVWLSLNLPIDYDMKGKGEVIEMYHEDGFGSPQFNTVNEAIKWIDEEYPTVSRELLNQTN